MVLEAAILTTKNKLINNLSAVIWEKTSPFIDSENVQCAQKNHSFGRTILEAIRTLVPITTCYFPVTPSGGLVNQARCKADLRDTNATRRCTSQDTSCAITCTSACKRKPLTAAQNKHPIKYGVEKEAVFYFFVF